MSAPVSLRNIPPHALHIAHCLSQQTGLSLADLLRQAIVSGLLVEATKFAPQEDGTLGGYDPATLAKALRRHLSSAIDVLTEYGEHPYQGVMRQGNKLQQERNPMQVHTTEALPTSRPIGEESIFFEQAIGNDLEMLGIGMSLLEEMESEAVLQKTLE